MDGSENLATLDVGAIVIGLCGGLALFLSGLEQMTDALKSVAGGGMKHLLARLTTNRFKAAFTGAFVTAVIQSSSVTTVLVVGFVSAGLLSLAQSVGIIMGANIGSTVTAQIIAFKITKYGLLMVAVGFALRYIIKHDRLKRYGSLIMGFGLIFYGMEVMSDSTQALRTYDPFIQWMRDMGNPLLGILAGAVFTALVQSSAVTTGIVIVLASQGFITLEAGIAIAFGANIGTCVTALLASIGKPAEALQAAAIHIAFNIFGVLIWVFFLDNLANFVRWFSPMAEGLEGEARRAAETPRQIANAHTVFNVANTLIFIWFTRPIAAMVQRLIPHRMSKRELLAQPQFLTDILLETPSLALDNVRRELVRLGDFALKMVNKAPATVLHGNKEDVLAIAKMDDTVDALHESIVGFLGRLTQEELTLDQARQVHDFIAAANYIENIGDTIETNLVTVGLERVGRDVQIGEDALRRMKPLFERIVWSVERSMVALAQADISAAIEVLDAKEDIGDLADNAREDLIICLSQQDTFDSADYRIEIDVIENLKRIYYFSKRIAKSVLDMEDESAAA